MNSDGCITLARVLGILTDLANKADCFATLFKELELP